MGDRKVVLFNKWRMASAFAVLLTAASAVIGPHAAAQSCAAVDLVVARGTQEPGYLGNFVGDPLYVALRAALPVSVVAYPVNYPANPTDPSSVGTGSADLVAHVADQAVACPDEEFILVGYSLGAGVVHAALGTGIVAGLPGVVQLPGDLVDRVAVVLLFGDPLRLIGWSVPDQYLDRTADFCAAGDPVCGGGTDPEAHAHYSDFIGAAVGFSAARF
ncbi:cutinase family protein [Nocardia sp. NBC_00565]|uniref:cutinase family protein n=1 Tax=Nocardia sp. NBC_00565 TaxID=2975993 RepID=UPI002E823FBC|nr:cutinase family protein [Nocardia sp. NBC_00565]WUC01654.1 cutinase family protein [Nocardia sp. NBC_00565]